jgi:hypothetical protein
MTKRRASKFDCSHAVVIWSSDESCALFGKALCLRYDVFAIRCTCDCEGEASVAEESTRADAGRWCGTCENCRSVSQMNENDFYERLAMPSSPSQFRRIRLARQHGSPLWSGRNERCGNGFLILAGRRMQAGTLECTSSGQPRTAEHRVYSDMPPPGTQTAVPSIVIRIWREALISTLPSPR